MLCAHCNKPHNRLTGEINRAKKRGLNIYCSLKCSRIGRRLHKTKAQLKLEKWWYDAFNRQAMRDIIKEKKAEYFQRDYKANPEKYLQFRKGRQKKHNNYCMRPEYRVKKKSYDESHRAKKMYGPYAEAALILKEIENLIDSHEARIDKNCHNKKQKRSKLWKNLQPST